jgi:hypothetical protein
MLLYETNMNAGVAEHQRCRACNQTIKQNMKAYKITHVPDQQGNNVWPIL